MEKCNKCGSEKIKRLFWGIGKLIGWGNHKVIKDLKNFTRNDDYYYQDEIEKECIVYQCSECKFSIAKEPLDIQTNKV